MKNIHTSLETTLLNLILLAYNFLTLIVILLLSPVWISIIFLTPKYRLRIGERLGRGLREKLSSISGDPKAKIIWVHALSVGETTSIMPLVRGLRKHYPKEIIILSTTTRSGTQLARDIATPFVDAIIPAPLDLLPVIFYFINTINPNLFILTETDFWPNWQLFLSRKGVPTVLVNGRFSANSYSRYRSFSWLFRPFFSSFSALSMQSMYDAAKLKELGVPGKIIHNLGNLKLDTHMVTTQSGVLEKEKVRAKFKLSSNAPIWVAGSTHKGEEQVILSVFKKLRDVIPTLQLVIAPRNIERGKELFEFGRQLGFSTVLRTDASPLPGLDILILNTIGELAILYQTADTAFVGGSLVDKGGHNPLEPAALGIPVAFGQHMEDFIEPAAALTSVGGAEQVTDEKELYLFMHRILLDPSEREKMGKAAQKWVAEHQGVVARHMDILIPLLSPPT